MGIVGCGWGGDVDSAQLHLIAVFTVPRARIFVHSLVFERTRIPRSVAMAPEPPLDYDVIIIGAGLSGPSHLNLSSTCSTSRSIPILLVQFV
jgi:hypothetical protein